MDWKKASHAGETFGVSDGFRMVTLLHPSHCRLGLCRHELLPCAGWDEGSPPLFDEWDTAPAAQQVDVPPCRFEKLGYVVSAQINRFQRVALLPRMIAYARVYYTERPEDA